jgi:hypothetical protein
MIQVSIHKLIEALCDANAFSLPELNDGTHYIFTQIYERLSQGEEVRLSGINFDSFELDDVDSMRKLYSDVLEANEYKADNIVNSFRSFPPVSAVTPFV